MNDIYSFYQLISKYQIEIPIIQRDYAQGRDNSKAADVRKSLVEKMIKAVEKENESLFFDFVYGRIEDNKFIPFDGQQRLTTLFLFHKYVFEMCLSKSECHHIGNCICKSILGRFSYATRQSSREFCDKLVQEKVIPSEDKKISNNIMNQPWFYPDWKKDPTVMGMLTMLDEIHGQIKGKKNFKIYAEKLTSGCNCPITFHFVDMGEHKLTDETYVKMNARGKQLTPFENFKASLEQYLEENKKQDLLDRLNAKIDGSWLDLFWKVASEGETENKLPDTLIMSFINRHFMNVWRCWYDQHQDAENDKTNKKIIDEMPLYPSKDDFVSWDVYKQILNKCDTNECLIPIFNIWDILCKEELNVENCCQAVWNRGDKLETEKPWSLYTGIINKDNRETYPSRIAFYALMMFFKENDNRISETLPQWMRVVWNIIENSTIDSSQPYHAALRLVNKLSIGCHHIYASLAKGTGGFNLGEQYHAKEQVEEEIAKARQILNNDCECVSNKDYGKSWEDVIKKAETYAFFKGAIRFLFQDGYGKVNWCHFDTKWENARKYFEDNGIKNNYIIDVTKALVIQCEKWEQIYDKQVFNPNASTWKWILCSKTWVKPIDNILTKELSQIEKATINDNSDVQKYITPILDKLPIKEMIEKIPSGRFRWNGKLGYYKPYGHDVISFDWDNFHRNKVLSELFDEGIIYTEQRIDGYNFFWGWDINFTYKQLFGEEKVEVDKQFDFQWNSDGFVYLLDNNVWKKKSKELDEFFRFDAGQLNDDKVKFCEQLRNLIHDSESIK